MEKRACSLELEQNYLFVPALLVTDVKVQRGSGTGQGTDGEHRGDPLGKSQNQKKAFCTLPCV